MKRFKTDENLPREVAELLRNAGYDELSILEQDRGVKLTRKLLQCA